MSFELLRHTRAKIIRGENGDDEVMIRFPVIQLAIMWGLALAVTFGVWLSNRDLGFTVRQLSQTVERLAPVVDKLDKTMPDEFPPKWFQQRIDGIDERLKIVERNQLDLMRKMK